MTLLHVDNRTIPIKGIVFDKDGTLVDFLHTWGYWVELMLDRFSSELKRLKLAPLSSDSYVLLGVTHRYGQGVVDYDRQGPLSVGSLNDLLTIFALQGYHRGLTWAQARLLAVQCQQAASKQLEDEQRIKTIPHVVELLQQCKQHQLKLAVATADDTLPARQQLNWLGIDSMFDTIIGHDSVARGKPYPDMIELVCRQLSLAPSEVVMIGDTNGDMMMARSSGTIASIAYLSDSSLHASDYPDADHLIYSYTDIAFS